MSEEIKLPFNDGFYDTCRHWFIADDGKIGRHAHTRKTVFAECAQVKHCQYYLLMEKTLCNNF